MRSDGGSELPGCLHGTFIGTLKSETEKAKMRKIEKRKPNALSGSDLHRPIFQLPNSGFRFETYLSSAARAFWNRPAWLFSAFAKVSNQSAISSKPSWRAVRAMPGYMSVYSCVSPAIAEARFLSVGPIGLPVAGSPTASRNSRWPWACPASPPAVERNTEEK